MRRLLAVACALALAAPAAAGGGAASLKIRNVEVGDYPTVRFAVVAPRALARPPAVLEGGRPAAGLEARNLGRSKSIVLAVDRSQSMAGRAISDASDAARAFVAVKPGSDRIAVVAVASKALSLTGFSGSTIDADSALRTIEVDRRYGTALFDSVVLSARALAGEPRRGRVIILLTDGQETTSAASLATAIRAANKAHAHVYPIGIESRDFRPAPLKRLARATGGSYYRAASSRALAAVYASIADELQRTWQVTYVTSARPGDTLALRVSAPGLAPGRADLAVPAGAGVGAVTPARGRSLPGIFYRHRLGPNLLGLAVGACVLLGILALSAARPGARLRRRLAPHVESERKRAEWQAPRERFATASAILRATERAFGNLRLWRRLHALIERADVPLTTVELVYIAAGFAFVLGLLAGVLAAPPLAILLTMAGGFALPIAFLWSKARRRIDAIEAQLPDLLITIAASLKAGHSFRQGLQAVVDEGQPPASDEFKRVLTDARLGRPMDDALGEMADRLGSKNLRFVITAVTIQRQVGGSLAGIFDMVADTVRQRQQFARKIRSLTAMGRMSAYVLAGIPFFLAFAITAMNPEYMAPLYTTSTGHKLIAVGLVMMAIGSLLLKKIVSFRG